MSHILITDAKVIQPGNPHHNSRVDIRIQNGIITEIVAARTASPQDAFFISFEELHISLGWVDAQCTLNDPGFEHRETLAELTTAAANGGFTDLIVQPNTQPALDNAQMIRAILTRSQNLPCVVHPLAAATLGAQGQDMAEMLEMLNEGAIGVSDGAHPVQDMGVLKRTLEYLKTTGVVLVQLPLNKAIEAGGVANESPAVTRLGLKASPQLAETMMVAQCIHVLQYTGGRLHLSPITSAASLSLIAQAQQAGLAITAGTQAPYLCFTDDALHDFDPLYKVRPPLRTEADRQAMLAALEQGILCCIASGHAPASIDEKRLEFDFANNGMAMLEAAFAALCTFTQLPLALIIEALSLHPRKLYGLPTPEIAVGQPACLTIFAPSQSWDFSPLQAHNPYIASPLVGKQLTGKPLGTIREGKLFLSAFYQNARA